MHLSLSRRVDEPNLTNIYKVSMDQVKNSTAVISKTPMY